MELRALSKYNCDSQTRFGDCILLIDSVSLIVYDCGHIQHARYIEEYLGEHTNINMIYIVVSHNDSDHTSGVCDLLTWLGAHRKYEVSIYTHQYLKHVDTIFDKIDDGRRNRERLKQSLLAEFCNITKIIEMATLFEFKTIEALSGTKVGCGEIVGPTIDEFTDVASQAVDSRQNNTIYDGSINETVMNAASIQLNCCLDDGSNILLCGDAHPVYLKSLNRYNLIQLPHHGQLDDAKAVFEMLGGKAYEKAFLISDNTGSATNSGGSEKLTEYMKEERYKPAYNTRNSIIVLRALRKLNTQERRCLGDMDNF